MASRSTTARTWMDGPPSRSDSSLSWANSYSHWPTFWNKSSSVHVMFNTPCESELKYTNTYISFYIIHVLWSKMSVGGCILNCFMLSSLPYFFLLFHYHYIFMLYITCLISVWVLFALVSSGDRTPVVLIARTNSPLSIGLTLNLYLCMQTLIALLTNHMGTLCKQVLKLSNAQTLQLWWVS